MPNDIEIAARIRDEREAGSRYLVRAHGPRVKSMLFKSFGDILDAQEIESVFGEAAARVVRSVEDGSFDPTQPLGPWFWTIAANIARNKLDGHMVGVSAQEVHAMLERKEDFILLDVRSPGEYEQVRLRGSTLIPLGALRGKLDQLPNDKPIVTFCKISLRGYEAALILRAAGFRDVRVMDGGIVMWPYETVT